MVKKKRKSSTNGKILIHDEVVRVSISKLKSNGYNPNKLSPLERRSLEHGIKTEGFTVPVLVQKSSNRFIDGEHRWKIASKLKMKEIPVIYLDVDDATARKMTLAMIHRKGSAKMEDVALVLQDIQEMAAQSLAQLELDTAVAQAQLQEMLDQVDTEGDLAEELGKRKKKKASKKGKGKINADLSEPDGLFKETEVGGEADAEHQYPLTFFAPTMNDRNLVRALCVHSETGELSYKKLKQIFDFFLKRHPKRAKKIVAQIAVEE